MSIETNKALMLRFYEEFWCKGNADAVDELVAPDFVDHQLPSGWQPGPEGLKQLVREWRTGFPDMWETVEDLIAEGDRVVGRFIPDRHPGRSVLRPRADRSKGPAHRH